MMSSSRKAGYDVALAGGGLANGLLVLALRRRFPRLRIALAEAGETVGGNHTWSFHESDLDDAAAALLDPLVERRWPRVEVRFPDHARTLSTPYRTVLSKALDRAVREALAVPGSRLELGAVVQAVSPTAIRLADGREISAPFVADARGPARGTPFSEATAYQKFVGVEVDLGPGARWPDQHPIAMDARGPQLGEFRFLYVLPFSERQVLVEDTIYADGPELDRPALTEGVMDHLRRLGFSAARPVRVEAGVLPLPLERRGTPPLGMPLRLGYQGGWLHPTTGYSLPIASRVAVTLAESSRALSPEALGPLFRHVAEQGRFCVRLNRMLFSVEAGARWRVLARFYRLPQPTIERFYALATTSLDRARILVGRRPRGVPWRAALALAKAV